MQKRMLGQTKRGYFCEENLLYKRVPEAEAGTGWITLGKQVQKLQSQNFSYGDPTADCNTSKQQHSKALG